MYYYAGTDTTSSYAAAKTKAAELAQDNELVILHADESSVNEIHQHLTVADLFSTKSVVWLKRPQANKEIGEWLLDQLDQLMSLPLVVWQDSNPDGRSKLVKQLKQLKRIYISDLPKTWELSRDLAKQLNYLDNHLAQQIAEHLVAVYQNDTGIIAQEMQKLADYYQATGSLDLDTARSLIASDVNADIWQLLDALTGGNKNTAVTQIHSLLQEDQNAHYLISMLARELTIIGQILDQNARNRSVQDLKLHPFVLKKAIAKAHNFSFAKVTKLLQALMRLDGAIKRGDIDPHTGLLLYALSW